MWPESTLTAKRTNNIIDLPGIFPGTLLQVQFEGIGMSQSRLIGLETGKFLIIRTPPIPDIWSKRYEKNHCIIRYLFSGRVYAFRCTLLGLVKEPYRLSIISYPEAIEELNLRKHERMSCIVAAEVGVGGCLFEGIISNISEGGCSFEFNRLPDNLDFPQLNIQDEVSIAMHLGDKSETTVFNAVLRSIHKDDENTIAGLQFTKSGLMEEEYDKSEKNLVNYLKTLQDGT
jgi:hypothetical protein